MKHFLMMIAVVFLSFTMTVEQADAKRLGSGSNTGKQRDVATQQQAHQQPAMSNTATAAPQQKSGMSKWLGPLAGLALGAGLFALLSSMGLDGALGGILLALLVGGIIGLIIYKLRKKAATMQPSQPFAPAPAGAAAQSSQSSMWNSMQPQQQPAQTAAKSSMWDSVQPAQSAAPAQQPAGSGLWGSMAGNTAAAAAPKVPAGFPVEAFLRSAQSVFTRLQAANDRKDLNDLRQFTTPEMYSDIAAQLQQRGNTIQKTEVLSLNASIIEVVTEGNLAIASVRFSGQIRENGGYAEQFDEIWHVQQDLNDKNGAWLLAGIQQTIVH